MNSEPQAEGGNSQPRSSREIKKQLADLSKVRAAAEHYGTPDFASRLGMRSILKHQTILSEELQAAEMLESGAAVELILDGDPVVQHSIHAGFLGNFLATVQHLINAVAQATTSTPTARAPVRSSIVAENRLWVSAGFPSSFGIRCTLPTKEQLGRLYEPSSQATLETVSGLLSDEPPSEDLFGLVSHSRVKKHYFDLLSLLAKSGANVRVRTRLNPYGTKFHTGPARERVEWLELLQANEEITSLIGVLVGGSIETARFELKLNDEETIVGKVSEEGTAQLRRITFGARVRAEVRVTTMIHEEGAIDPKISYFLDSVTPETEFSP